MGSAFTSVDLLCEPAILARHGTSLRPVSPPDSLWLATAHEPEVRCPRGQRSQCRVHSQSSGVPARLAGKPVGSAQELASIALALFRDLACREIVQHYDERGRHYRATQQRVGGSRNAIRRYIE
jgi:hypothetical protein